VSTERREDSSTIKAVILDYGKVLSHSPAQEEFGRMAEMFNVSFESFCEHWQSGRDSYDRGDLTAEEYWLKLAAQTNTNINRQQIETLRQVEVEIWTHIDPDMLDWVSRLHAAGFKTGLLSNMPWDMVTHVRTKCDWMGKFSFQTLSAELRQIKPHPAIYEHALNGLGVAAEETLFLDDRETNVVAARSLGMRAIEFRSVPQLKDDLTALSFPVLPVIANPLGGEPGVSTERDADRFRSLRK
jgi:putative hydrolase of the HAD superfamily